MTAIAENAPTTGAATMASLAGKYLTFTLDRASYAIPVLKVREIIRVAMATDTAIKP